MNFELWTKIDQLINEKKSLEAISYLTQKLQLSKDTIFSPAITDDFLNNEQELLKSLETFIQEDCVVNEIKAIYVEMNGFDINPDKWFFNFFGYKAFETDLDDLDWICEWDWESDSYVVLTGMERTQKAFETFINSPEIQNSEEENKEICLLLVLTKFINLFERTLKKSALPEQYNFFYTAHDFDTLGSSFCSNYS